MMHLPNHWPYIAAAYGLTIGCSLVLGIGAALRLHRAKTRLAAVESQLRHRESSAS